MEKVKFLDYEITNSGNSDGWVITKPSGELYECNLGNYNSLEAAKKDCVLFYMIHRPAVFARNICNRIAGSNGTCHDYYLFTGVIKKEGLLLPIEVTKSRDLNCGILFNNQKL